MTGEGLDYRKEGSSWADGWSDMEDAGAESASNADNRESLNDVEPK